MSIIAQQYIMLSVRFHFKEKQIVVYAKIRLFGKLYGLEIM